MVRAATKTLSSPAFVEHLKGKKGISETLLACRPCWSLGPSSSSQLILTPWRRFAFLRRLVRQEIQERTYAAEDVQALFRGFAQRRRYQVALARCVTIQRYARGWLARRWFRPALR